MSSPWSRRHTNTDVIDVEEAMRRTPVRRRRRNFNLPLLCVSCVAILFFANAIFLGFLLPNPHGMWPLPSAELRRPGIQNESARRKKTCPSYGCSITPLEVEDANETVQAILLHPEVHQEPKYGTKDLATITYASNQPHYNQDSAIAIVPFNTTQTPPSQESFLIGIFDGHGQQGRTVSRYVSRDLPERLARKFNEVPYQADDEWIIKTLKETFVETDTYAPPNALLGGCTASVTLRRGSKLFFANTGDSRTIFVTAKKEQGMEIPYMTRKDKAHLPEELARIEGLGGKVNIPEQNPNLSRVFAFCPSLRETVGLAMSRSIGDWEMKPIGVIAEPIVDVVNLEDYSNAFVLAASDGIWDLRKPEFFARVFAKSFYQGGDHPLVTSRDVILRAAPKNPAWYRDDITLVAIRVKQSGHGLE